jgi:ABC-type branched-subunit amino acid transport system ATPase component
VIAHPNGLAEVFSRLLKWLSNRLPIANREATATGPSHSAIDNAEAISHSAKTLQVENLSVQFGGLVALDKVSFTLPPGQVVGLIGPNGAGKTTMIDTITGFTAASSGSIFLDGARCNNDTAMVRARAGLGRTFQSLELFDDLTVADNLRVACDPRQRRFYLADLFGSKALPFPPSVMHTIETFGLTTSLDCYPQQLSFGQRRLLGIARAVAANPAVLLLDEPAAGLDSNESRELGEIIRWLAAQKNMAILLVEHDMGLVMSICDRLVVLDFGHKLAEGSPTEISQNPAVIKAYLGGHGNE